MFVFLKKIIAHYLALPFLILIFLTSSYYLLQSGFFYVHDFPIAARIAEMAGAISSGHFPVRWSANFGYGFGMPLFNFYAPLPYALAALLYFLNINLINLIKIFYLLINFLTLWGSFKLGKRLAGVSAGLALALLFTLAPYRALLLFVRGALSEAFALAFFPWAMLALVNLIKNKGQLAQNHLLLFLSLLAIVLSHNLSALIFIPLLLIFALLLAGKKIWSILLTFILAALTSSFYILPAFFEKDLTRVAAIFTDYFDYRLQFVYIRQLFWDNWGYGGSSWGVEDHISFFLGYGQYLSLFILAFLLIKNFYLAIKKEEFKKILKKRGLKITLIFTGLFLLSLFLSLQKSQFFWSLLPVLSYLQFPWRWLGPASFFLAVAFSASLFLIKKPLVRYLLVLIILIFGLSNFRYFRGKQIIDQPSNFYTGDTTLIASDISQTLPDYIPIQMAKQKTLQDFNKNYPQPLVWLEGEDVEVTVLDAQLLKKQTHRQIWSLNLEQDQLVNFKLANFSGWQAKVNGQKTKIFSNPRLGNIQLELAAGENEIELWFGESQLRLIADYLSLFGLLSFLIWLYFLKKKTANH
jgi:hypothetical protein